MKSITIFLFLILLGVSSIAQTMNDVETIKDRIIESQLSIPSAIKENEVEELISAMDNSGKWMDINYEDQTAAGWKPSQHVTRLLGLAKLFVDKNSPFYKNAQLKDCLLKGIDFWVNNTPFASNYWWNSIGVPGMLGPLFILLEDELAVDTIEKGCELMKICVKPDYYDYHGIATGQNLLWSALSHLYACCLSNDLAGLERVFSSVASEIIITEQEGIQPDFSFYQHKNQNYAMGYGKAFVETAVKYFYLANETSFQFNREKIDIIAHYLLDGMQWMSWYDQLEYTAMGREISRKGKSVSSILRALEWMEEIDPSREAKYRSFQNRLSNDRTEKPLTGNRYFWRSDLMIHQRDGYYFSLKGTSDRILSGESGNGENLKGYYQGNGTYYLMRTGNEYGDIFPVFNWRKLPGLLCEQKTEPFPLFDWGKGTEGETSFVYGLSDGLYGCFGYDYSKDGVKAKRAWFLFDHEIVCLVNGVEGDSLYQSINQVVSHGKMWSDNSEKGVGEEFQKVYHDSIGYLVDANGFYAELSNQNQSGSWKEITTVGSEKQIEKDIFSLGISFGEHASNAKISYVVLPGLSLEELKEYQLDEHITILKNTSELQAVYQKDIDQMQAVFFRDGDVNLPWDNLSLNMKHPGLIMIKKKENKLVVEYGQPFPQQHFEINLSVSKALENDEIQIAPN